MFVTNLDLSPNVNTSVRQNENFIAKGRLKEGLTLCHCRNAAAIAIKTQFDGHHPSRILLVPKFEIEQLGSEGGNGGPR
jgi:hypothetical protein